jgi:hypothetical protein
MKRSFWLLAAGAWMVLAVFGFSQETTGGKATIKMVSGEVMSGTAGAVRDGSLSLITDYGPIRIPLDKISAESKAKLGISSAAVSTEAMAGRIRELEDLVAKLREENAALRRAATSAIQPAVGGSYSGSTGVRPGAAPAAAGEAAESYRMSTTGKRHNSNCRYYSSKGRACGPGDGVACKICGG